MFVVLTCVCLAVVLFVVMRVMLSGRGRFGGGCVVLLRDRTQRQK
jgi:hypothetical protein